MSYTQSDATREKKLGLRTLNHDVEKLSGFGEVRGNE